MSHDERSKDKRAFFEQLESLEEDDDIDDPGLIAAYNVLKDYDKRTKIGNEKKILTSKGRSHQDHTPVLSQGFPDNITVKDNSTRALNNKDNAPPAASPDRSAKKAAIPSLPQGSSVTVERQSAKRKRVDTIRLVAKDQRIFSGFKFFFVPNDNVNAARRIRIHKAIEYGATWIRDWHQGITHIIADKQLTLDDVLKVLKTEEVPADVILVNDTYPSDCIVFRTLVKPRHDQHSIKGHTLPASGSPTNPDSMSLPRDVPDPSSLQLKPAKDPDFSIEPRTPARTEESANTVPSNPMPVCNPSQIQIHENETRISQHTSTPGNEALERAIQEAKAMADLPLDLDDEDTSPATTDDFDSDNHEDDPLPKRKGADPSINWQARFSCMQEPGERTTSPNASTIAILQQMANIYTTTQDTWRSIAYRKAIAILRKHPKRITTKAEAEALPGIGTRLAEKIEEIVWTKRLRRLDNAVAEPDADALKLFLAIYGVGFSQAARWIEKGHRTIPDLIANADLTDNQRLGIEHINDFATRIPRREVEQLGNVVARVLADIDPLCQLIIGGSYRRGAQDSGDIDLVITKPGAALPDIRAVVVDTLVPRLLSQGFLTATLAATSKQGAKWHGACQLPIGLAVDAAGYRPWRRIDFLLVPWDELGAAMIYFTGDDIFNRSMRLLARKKGLRLNQRGLYRDVTRTQRYEKMTEGTKMEGRDERRIFEVLGVPWREPEARVCA